MLNFLSSAFCGILSGPKDFAGLSNPFHLTALLYYLCFAYWIKENEKKICLNQEIAG